RFAEDYRAKLAAGTARRRLAAAPDRRELWAGAYIGKGGKTQISGFFLLFMLFQSPYGSFTVKRQPTSRFSTSTWPPRVVSICFTRASPRPLPSAWWELSLW